MKISFNWLSELVDMSTLGATPAVRAEKLGELLTKRGLEVESIERQDTGFDNVVSAQILERNPHPQADRLSLCKVSLGQGDPLEIVCGAQNMKAGDKVVLAQIGAKLPNGLKIELSKIRGVVSNGMLCSEEELGLKEKADGILILPAETALGVHLAKILGRDDTTLTLKLTANRADCLGHFGIAREVGAALGVKPNRVLADSFGKAQGLGKGPIQISLNAGEKAPQFFGCTIEGVKIAPSPVWVVKRLEALGARTINNVVDASNLVLWETGHPVHAYDADKIQGGQLGVRLAHAGDDLPLLDGTSVKLTGEELVIADSKDLERAIGLAGVMGGGNSEVSDSTSRVYLECAEFDPVLVRRASSCHLKKTEASHRFERGVDPQGLGATMERFVELVLALAGGRVAAAEIAKGPNAQKGLPEIQCDPRYFGQFLGMKVSSEEAQRIFEGLECRVEHLPQGGWKVVPPSYRLDLRIKEDLAEEIARALGYDKIEETIPRLSSAPRSIGVSVSRQGFELQGIAKDLLAAQGLCECVNFAFCGKKRLEEFGLESNVKVINPLSEDHEFLVPSLIPGLIHSALGNWNHHFGSEVLPIRLFELRPTFSLLPGHASVASDQAGNETGVQASWKLAFLLAGSRTSGGLQQDQGEIDFFDLKAVVERLFLGLGTKGVRIHALSEGWGGLSHLFHPGQAAEILIGKDRAGVIGLLHPAKNLALKARGALWIGELDWAVIAKLSRPVTANPVFKAWPQFPTMERDFALLVGESVTADKLTQVALKAGRPLAKVSKIFDIYRGKQVAQGMTSVAVRVIFYEETRSLQESEVEAASAKILESWKKELGVQLRS
ncbi:phenylalanine--tRNA ligase subunit beta [Bdellovibrionota bacterium FG-2]